MSEPSNPYSVGRGKPPLETRFQPGKSGNPGGRPKGRKTAREVFAIELARIIASQIEGQEGATVMQGLVKGAIKKAAKDPDYFLRMMRFVEGYSPPPPEGPIDELTALLNGL